MLIPEDLFYTAEHLWLKKDKGGLLLGVTDYAQESMGALDCLELPAVGTQLSRGCYFGGAETCKSVNELFAPLDAVVEEVNEGLFENPGIINDSPYEDGWILRLKDYKDDDLDTLLDARVYMETLE